MKKIVRQRLVREKRRIERRLKMAVVVNEGRPVLRGGKIEHELSCRTRGIAHGGMGMVQRVVRRIGLAEAIDASVSVLKIHNPYHESDHVLNDTDFSLTTELDRWNDDGVRFVFGYDARANMIAHAGRVPDTL